MSGRMVQIALRALDRAASVLLWGRRSAVAGHQPPEKAEPAHLATGRRGEEEAYFYLRSLGYVMVARNWRSPRQRSEIDLIGWDGDVLCFIEVKTRTTRDVKPAEAAVDYDKQHDLALVAREYLRRVSSRTKKKWSVASGQSPERQSVASEQWSEKQGGFESSPVSTDPLSKDELATDNWPLTTGLPPFRFDIVSVYYENSGASPAITLFRNAFAVA